VIFSIQQVMDLALWALFERFRPPLTMAEAAPQEVEALIRPFGLQTRRAKALISLSREYLQAATIGPGEGAVAREDHLQATTIGTVEGAGGGGCVKGVPPSHHNWA
jgi:hypothetical protein